MSLSSLALLLMAGTSPLAAAPISAPEDPPVVVAKEDPPAKEDPAAKDTQARPDVQDSGEIVVTARRRAERIQEVPIALTVVGGDELEKTGTYNLNRLQQSQPALQFYSSNPRNSAINIRGLGAPFGLTNDGIEQGVGFYVDQVYIGRVGASTFDFVDVDRVEVLRGPQGTLYGKNTTAGAVNITTRAPSFTPESKVELSGGNYDFIQAKASLSGPLSDKVALRISSSITSRGGTIYNVRTDEYLHRQSTLGFRGQLLWKPSANLDLTLAGDFNQQNPLCCVQIYARTGATQRALNRQYAGLAAAAGYTPPSTDPFDRVTDLDARINSRQEIGGASLVANWDLGPATLTSVTAWRYWDWQPANDRDFIGLPITTVSQNPSQQQQVSQELRLTSNGSSRLEYTLGAFFFHQKIDTQGSQVQGSAASAWLLNPTSAGGRNPDTLNGLTSTNDIHFKNDSFALFGKLNWEALKGLHIQPGLRLNYDRKSGSYIATVSINNATYPNKVATCANPTTLNADQLNTLAPQCYDPEFSAWNVSGDLTVSYDFARDVHGYATYARSFKSGGINLSGLPLNSTNTAVDLTKETVKPEKVDHFELGLKTQFLDRRVTFNIAGFWTEISNYQATVNNGQTTVIRGYLANADKVRVRGVEFDSSFRPSQRLNLYVNGAYTDAKYKRFVNAPCPPELSGGNPALNGATPAPAGTPGLSPLVCDISGQVLPGISKWAFAWGGEVNVPVGSGQAYLGYDGSWRSKFSSNPSPSAYTWIDGYSLSNVRAGWRRDDLNVYAWVRNAFDQHYFELLSTQSGSTGLIVGQPGDPRTYGLTISKSF
ncbi:TonB-dependent receptor [Sphingomonas sp. JC676]|uniref:TonB-dependent receptor n=1 Tax=Sphingomonas sp. JC676 TaxID=2768065 RepID=UPI00165811A5|nr:TonB-dependent receptor [Sphingomonas sp. JC676]MBC9031443.1 TonB-dependent receptor [Sphingomonas sp. JC676]